ncbi:conserved hypothetical protein [Mesorhizobium ventifaucium]|uniref:Uncharacterized protein n=1 Tax=Mesorhizobium ventifaucium TaxID=666020 RepID=A0ABN8JEC5_9HYPH|nr:conserved hypothetical protein [Mesorhizobium ventifaucium]
MPSGLQWPALPTVPHSAGVSHLVLDHAADLIIHRADASHPNNLIYRFLMILHSATSKPTAMFSSRFCGCSTVTSTRIYYAHLRYQADARRGNRCRGRRQISLLHRAGEARQ